MLYVSIPHIKRIDMFGLPFVTVLSVGAGTGIIILALLIWGLKFKEVKI